MTGPPFRDIRATGGTRRPASWLRRSPGSPTASSPKLLILDESAHHLDLDSLEALEDVPSGHDGALLVVSHDAAFLEAIGVERYVEFFRSSNYAEP